MGKFKTFLDHLGSMFRIGAATAIAIEAKLIPAEQTVVEVVSMFSPALGGTFEAILGSVVKVEQVATAVGASTGTGIQKLTTAVPEVEQAILGNPLFKGKQPKDLALYNKALVAITSAAADLLNAFEAPAG